MNERKGILTELREIGVKVNMPSPSKDWNGYHKRYRRLQHDEDIRRLLRKHTLEDKRIAQQLQRLVDS